MDIFVLVVPWLSPIKVAVELKSPALVTGTMRRAGGFFSCPDYGAIFKPPIPLLVSRELWAMHVCSQSATIVDERVQWWACAGKNSPRRSHSVSYYSLSVFCFFYLYTRSPENKAKGRNTLPDASAVENTSWTNKTCWPRHTQLHFLRMTTLGELGLTTNWLSQYE